MAQTEQYTSVGVRGCAWVRVRARKGHSVALRQTPIQRSKVHCYMVVVQKTYPRVSNRSYTCLLTALVVVVPLCVPSGTGLSPQGRGQGHHGGHHQQKDQLGEAGSTPHTAEMKIWDTLDDARQAALPVCIYAAAWCMYAPPTETGEHRSFTCERKKQHFGECQKCMHIATPFRARSCARRLCRG